MSKLICGCSRVVLVINDGKNTELTGVCAECLLSDGAFYKSSAWKETTIEKRAVEERAKRLTGLR